MNIKTKLAALRKCERVMMEAENHDYICVIANKHIATAGTESVIVSAWKVAGVDP